MRHTISALIAAIAVFTAAPAMACGGLFGGGCSPCNPCAQTYVQTYSGCTTGCGAAYERLPDPEVQYHAAPAAMPQYYYVDQGPTYSGPGNYAPYPVYREGAVSGLEAYRYRRHYAPNHGRRYGHREHVLRRYY